MKVILAIFSNILWKIPSVLAQSASVQRGFVQQPPESQPLPNVRVYAFVADLIKIALAVMGVLGLIAIIVSGSMLLFAQGNEELIKKARGIMYYALLGLVIAGAAYAIVFGIIGFELQNAPEDFPITP